MLDSTNYSTFNSSFSWVLLTALYAIKDSFKLMTDKSYSISIPSIPKNQMESAKSKIFKTYHQAEIGKDCMKKIMTRVQYLQIHITAHLDSTIVHLLI